MAGAAAMAPVTEGGYKTEYKLPRGFDLGHGKVRSLQNRLMRLYESMAFATNDHINWWGRLQFCDSDLVKKNMADALECLRQGRDEAVNLILELINLGELPVPPPEDLDAEVHRILGLPRLHQTARLAEFVAHEWKSPRVAVLKFQEWQAARLDELKAHERQAAQVISLKARVAELKAQLEKATGKAYNTATSTAGQSAAQMSAKEASTTGGGFVASAGSRSTGSRFDMGGKYLDSQIPKTPNLRTFTFMELKAATNNFSSDSILGEGRFARVHKGWVDEKTLVPTKNGTGMAVVVKKLNTESIQGYEEWQSEINFLGSLSHPNLVKILGYCFEDEELFLVYAYVAKGTLENCLFRRGCAPLSWELRLKIAIGAARGLAFLHASEKQVNYRWFKSSNILLDANYNVKIYYFGLDKLGPTRSNSNITTRVMGTYGYAAPEYASNAHLSLKSDVYSFGVMLLEMLSGQRALDPNCPKLCLTDWAKLYLADRQRLARLMDPRFEGQYNSKQAFQAAQLTLKCLTSEPRCRPSMKEVLETLEQIESTKSRAREAWEGGSSSLRNHHHGRCAATHQPRAGGELHGRGSIAANVHVAKAW